MSVKHQNYIVAALFMIACGFITARAIAETRPVDPAHIARHYGLPQGRLTARFHWEFPEVELIETVYRFRKSGFLKEIYCECRDGTSIVFDVLNGTEGVGPSDFTCISDQDNIFTDFDSDRNFLPGAIVNFDITAVNGSPSDCSIFAYF